MYWCSEIWLTWLSIHKMWECGTWIEGTDDTGGVHDVPCPPKTAMWRGLRGSVEETLQLLEEWPCYCVPVHVQYDEAAPFPVSLVYSMMVALMVWLKHLWNPKSHPISIIFINYRLWHRMAWMRQKPTSNDDVLVGFPRGRRFSIHPGAAKMAESGHLKSSWENETHIQEPLEWTPSVILVFSECWSIKTSQLLSYHLSCKMHSTGWGSHWNRAGQLCCLMHEALWHEMTLPQSQHQWKHVQCVHI